MTDMPTPSWEEEKSPLIRRRAAKTLEEVLELGAVLSRIQLQGLMSEDPDTGVLNIYALVDELADVQAQLDRWREILPAPLGTWTRAETKRLRMRHWEKHLPDTTDYGALDE